MFRAKGEEITSSQRIRFVGHDLDSLPQSQCRATVRLEWRGQTFRGKAERGVTEHGGLRAIADATADAIEGAVGVDVATMKVLDLSIVNAFGTPAVIVALSLRANGDDQYAVGFCVAKEDLEQAAVRAVLNATNRFLQWVFDTAR